MDREKLLELAARCEAATGPDREIEAEIDIALGMFPEQAYRQRMAMRARGSAQLDRLEWMVADRFTRSLTSSLDAAMTLVPDGLEWELFAYDAARDPRFGRFQARIMLMRYPEDPEEMGPQAISNGVSPALALTAAALRALAYETGETP